MGLHLEKVAIVHDAGDDVFDVVGLVGVVGYQAVQGLVHTI
jgi:hypothetical protein